MNASMDDGIIFAQCYQYWPNKKRHLIYRLDYKWCSIGDLCLSCFFHVSWRTDTPGLEIAFGNIATNISDLSVFSKFVPLMYRWSAWWGLPRKVF